MTRLTRTTLLAAALLCGFAISAAESKKPKLDLRVVPRMAPPSTEFLFVADLQGGADGEALYCPTLEWNWGSGDESSVQQEECPPFEAGVSKIERRFSIRRAFPEGPRTAKLTLRKDDKLIAVASVSFRVTWEKGPPSMTVRDPR